MIRLYIALGILTVCIAAGYYIAHQIEQTTVLRSSLESAAATITAQAKEKELTDKLMVDTIHQREALHRELNKTKTALASLTRTPAQLACDRLPLPDGYLERLLHANNAH